MEAKLIGTKIAKARKKINISQAQLAKHLFISQQAVGKWERGESMPDIITLARLAELLSVDLNYFSDNFKTSETKSVDLPSGKIGWNMSEGNWKGADFSGLDNLYEKFSSSNLQSCLFVGSDLSGLLLRSNHVDGCDFSGSDFSNSQIQNSHIVHNLFKECKMKEAKFSGSHIKNCDFSGVDFTGASIKSSSFEKNTMANAIWDHTSFNASDIAGIVFEGIVKDCYFEGCSFSRLIFQNATLTNTFFKNNSLKGIRFVNCKADRLTYEFLKLGKADLKGVELLQ
jgi:uncharacterized protein YjbI with pentapeptide repeats